MVKQNSKTASINDIVLPKEVWEHHQQSFISLIDQWTSSKKVTPVLLLTGPQGVGKRSVSIHLSRWLLCESNGIFPPEELSLFGSNNDNSINKKENNYFPCETCTNCQRSQHGNWVDFTEISPTIDKEGKASSIKIDQLKEIQTTQHRGGHEGKLRLFLIKDINRMSPQAANSLLKLLEEPPHGWVFFLTVTDDSLVLPTLLSRCQRIRLKPFSESQLKKILTPMQISKEKIDLCAKLAQGSWKNALALVEESNWKQRQLIFSFLNSPDKEFNPLIDWASKSTQNLTFLLNQLEQILSDLIHWSIHQESSPQIPYNWINTDGKKELIDHAKKVERKNALLGAREFWFECHEKVSYTRKVQNTPLNKKIMIQDLLFPWLD